MFRGMSYLSYTAHQKDS